MMFLPNIFLFLSDRHLYNACGVFACVWCEVTHPLTNSFEVGTRLFLRL